MVFNTECYITNCLLQESDTPDNNSKIFTERKMLKFVKRKTKIHYNTGNNKSQFTVNKPHEF